MQGIRHTDKKENKIFLIYKEIQKVAVSKSYMRKGFLRYEEMRKFLVIYEEVVSYMTLQQKLYDENLFFFFISAADNL
jgi:hypothetical protein